jgi:hypothetical protein
MAPEDSAVDPAGQLPTRGRHGSLVDAILHLVADLNGGPAKGVQGAMQIRQLRVPEPEQARENHPRVCGRFGAPEHTREN